MTIKSFTSRQFDEKSLILFLLLGTFLLPIFAAADSLHKDADTKYVAILNRAMAKSLYGDNEALWKDVMENAQTANPKEPLHLEDNLIYLYAAGLRERESFIYWQKKIKRAGADAYLTEQINNNLQQDEYLAALSLLRQNRYNNYTSGLNRASSAVSSLFQGQMQPLFQLPIDLIYGTFRVSQSSPLERKASFLLNQSEKKYSAPPNSEEYKKLNARFSEKRKKQLFKQEYNLGKLNLRREFLDTALFHFQNALVLNPQSEKIKKKIEAVHSLKARQNRKYLAAMSVLAGEEYFHSKEEESAYGTLVNAVAAGNASLIFERARKFNNKYPQSNYADDASYAAPLAVFYSAKKEDFFKEARQIPRNYPRTNAADYAREIIANPNMNSILAVEQAEKARAAELRKFILFGARSTDEQIYMVSSGAAGAPQSAAQNLGVFFALDVAVRGVQSIFSAPVPADNVMDAAAIYVREFPYNKASLELRKKLATLSQKQGQYEKTLQYAKSAGDYSPEYLKKLEDRYARHLFVLISQHEDSEQKTRHLSRLVAEYPNAPVVKQAKAELDRLGYESAHEFRISRADLIAYPELRLHTGLDLDPALIDGRRENGEITAEGIRALKDGPIIYHIESEGADRVIAMNPEQRELLKLKFEEIRSGSTKSGEKDEKKEKPFPLEVAGGVGSRGAEASPAFGKIPYLYDDLDLYR